MVNVCTATPGCGANRVCGTKRRSSLKGTVLLSSVVTDGSGVGGGVLAPSSVVLVVIGATGVSLVSMSPSLPDSRWASAAVSPCGGRGLPVSRAPLRIRDSTICGTERPPWNRLYMLSGTTGRRPCSSRSFGSRICTLDRRLPSWNGWTTCSARIVRTMEASLTVSSASGSETRA